MANIDFKTIGQGRFQKTGPRSGKFFGPKHAGKGIRTVGPDGNMIEVEGGESVGEVNTNAGKQPYIYSEYVKRHGGVSYADEFDRMVNNGASQQELDMLAAEQDSRAKRTGGEIQVTPMQYGGLHNNLNNKKMNNYYRRGGIPQYQGQVYSGVGDDIGPAAMEQRTEAREKNPRKTNFFERFLNTILYPISYVGENITEWPKSVGSFGGRDEWGSKEDGRMPYEGFWSGTGQYGGVPSNISNDRNRTAYGSQGNSNQVLDKQGNIVVIWPNGGTKQGERPMQYGGITPAIPIWPSRGQNMGEPIGNQGLIGGAPFQGGDSMVGYGPQGGDNMMGVTPGIGPDVGKKEPCVKQMSCADGYTWSQRLCDCVKHNMFGLQSGGLTNRVMRYQGDTGSNIMPLNAEGNPQEMPMQEQVDQPRPGAVQQSSDMIQQMMDMLKFSGGGGVKSLPIEAQSNIRQEFESMTEPERQQWINFMSSPGTTEQSPTRADPESELIERIMQQQSGGGGGQRPLGPEAFQ